MTSENFVLNKFGENGKKKITPQKWCFNALNLQCGAVAGIGMELPCSLEPWTTQQRYGTLTSMYTVHILYRTGHGFDSNLHYFSGVCMLSLRGHADSVNSVQFLPYSNMLATCSADKTVSLWDARTVG